jgi:ATP-binding cassette subfamily C protein CydCD
VRPLDPRLLRHARGGAVYLGVLVALGAGTAGLVIAQAGLLAGGISGVVSHGLGLASLRTTLVLLAVVVAGRAALAWLTEAAGYRASAAVKSTLRRRLLARAVARAALPADRRDPAADPAPPGDTAGGGAVAPGGTGGGPSSRAADGTARLAALATRGIDALDGYFARYLPQLVLAVLVPVAVLARIVAVDPVSAVTVALTLPLIPVFMILIGLATAAATRRRFDALDRLAHHFLDVVAGLPTLTVFNRARAQAGTIRRITDSYRRATMRTLRLAFLSSLVLELLATLSVALVAVGVGLRLVGGHLDLYTALLVLVLAPEAYLPLRAVGTHYHASADGLAAAEEVFRVLETPLPGTLVGQRHPAGNGGTTAPAGSDIVVDRLRVTHPGRPHAAPDGASLHLSAGRIVAVTGPSGAGKSTLIAALLGFVTPDGGRILADGHDLTTLDPDGWRRRIGWAAQDPYLCTGTVADNIRLGRPGARDAWVRAAARDAALDLDLDRPAGERGSALSAGQRRRVGLARALLRDTPILLLDEPTAGLDPATETRVLRHLRAVADAGRTILLAAHHPAALTIADDIVTLPTPGATPVRATAKVARP